jgi:hypothetical protein
LDEAAAFAFRAKEAGPPCSECRYKTLLGMCGNPACSEQSFEPSTGDYSIKHPVPVAEARADGGLCGPEALLFEPIGWLVPFLRGTWRGVTSAYFVAVGGLILAVWLLG